MKATVAIAAVTLAFATVAVLFSAPPVSAETVRFVLFVHSTKGWGFYADAITKPGPTLVVNNGDNVSLTLASADTANHNWFVDYDNDTNADADEPKSPTFSDPAPITWNFIANRSGTFNYRDLQHKTMIGTIIIQDAGFGGGLGGLTGFDWRGFIGSSLFLYIIVGVVGLVVLVTFARRRRGRPRRHRSERHKASQDEEDEDNDP